MCQIIPQMSKHEYAVMLDVIENKLYIMKCCRLYHDICTTRDILLKYDMLASMVPAACLQKDAIIEWPCFSNVAAMCIKR